jgi:hypothetical protein
MAQGPSAWFPAMSVYRQDPSGSWREAMDRLSKDLSITLKARGP